MLQNDKMFPRLVREQDKAEDDLRRAIAQKKATREAKEREASRIAVAKALKRENQQSKERESEAPISPASNEKIPF